MGRGRIVILWKRVFGFHGGRRGGFGGTTSHSFLRLQPIKKKKRNSIFGKSKKTEDRRRRIGTVSFMIITAKTLRKVWFFFFFRERK